jgi:hypothetical protein
VGDAPVDYFAVNVDGSGLARISEYNYETDPRPEEKDPRMDEPAKAVGRPQTSAASGQGQ